MKNIKIKFKALFFLAAIFISVSAYSQSAIKQIKIKSDFDSPHCKNRIEDNISMEKGVKKVVADLATHTIIIDFQNDKNSAEALVKVIRKLGYEAAVITEEETKTPKHKK